MATTMSEADGAWVEQHVLAPRTVYPQQPHCPCQITSFVCRRGEHDACGHDYWRRYEAPEPEGRLLDSVGMPVVDSSRRYSPTLNVWLADRACRTYCNCWCHQPPAPTRAVAVGGQLDLFGGAA